MHACCTSQPESYGSIRYYIYCIINIYEIHRYIEQKENVLKV